ncbi:hypothetical protein D3C81_607160 [compost metagenome]
MKKVASTQKVAEGEGEGNDVIVSPEDVPGATDGATIQYNGEQFQVVNANYSDEFGAGVVLRAAAYEGLENDPMGLAMGAPATSVSPAPAGQQYHYTKNEIQQTYDFDQDAQWGSSSAAATEQMIAGENAVDRTTIPGKFTNSPGLNTAPAAPIADPNGVQVSPTAQPAAQAPVAQPAAQPNAVQAPVAQEPVVQDAPAQPVEDAQPAQEPVQDEEVKEEEKTANRILARIRAKQG